MPVYDFAVGNPDPKSFPSRELAEAAANVLTRAGESLAVYPDQRGHLPLREIAAERFQRNNGVELPVANVALTSGSMQAISLICQTYLKPGDAIITEDYSYSGSLTCFRKYQARIVGVDVDDEGMTMDGLEQAILGLAREGVKPKFIYAIATNQNPTGTILPEDRRRRLLELANEHDILVLEDDCYADLIFEGDVPHSMYSMDPDRVIYIGSFSKILGPGARLGYFAAKEETLAEVLYWKIDAGTSNLSAFIAAEYFKREIWQHIDTINGVVKEKLDAVVQALDANTDAFIEHSHPRGGLFIWVKLPSDTDPLLLAEIAAERGVRYGLGKNFYSQNKDIPALRIAYGYSSLEDIRDGIPLLADCVREARGVIVKAASAP